MDAPVPAVSLMALIVLSGDGSATVMCIHVLPTYTGCVVKFPKLTTFCSPSTICLGWHAKTSPRCTEYPGLELLSLSLQTSLWEEALWRHLQELPAAALRHRPGRCLWCSWSVWLQAAQSRPCCFISPQGTALHPTDVTCCSIPACACHIAFSPHGVTSVSL